MNNQTDVFKNITKVTKTFTKIAMKTDTKCIRNTYKNPIASQWYENNTVTERSFIYQMKLNKSERKVPYTVAAIFFYDWWHQCFSALLVLNPEHSFKTETKQHI